MGSTDTQTIDESLLQAFLSDERFWPAEPRSMEDLGLPMSLVESLACKHLAVMGTTSGRSMAEAICLPFIIFEDILASLRTRQLVVHSGTAPFNDYYYVLTEAGQQHAQAFRDACAYVGPAPVPLKDYVISVEAQCISTEAPTDEDLATACRDISVDSRLFDLIGPAVNSGAGMFLFGAPGNGKSTLAKRITLCFGQEIWIPRTICEDGQIIKLFDTSYHREIDDETGGIIRNKAFDQRWVRIQRPTVSVGGELTMNNLEIQYDSSSGVSEAPLQMKSNGGCLLIDDFGRQRIEPAELLNRWIVPLENGHDYLTLVTGKKIQVPFEQLIVFSTNLEPRQLVDEAFLRRIPYKVEVGDPSEAEFRTLFELYATRFSCPYEPDVVDYLIETHYRSVNRARRRCHPRDLLKQIRNYCRYRRLPFEMRKEYFDRVVDSYFATVFGAGEGLFSQPIQGQPTSSSQLSPISSPLPVAYDSTAQT